VNGLFTIGQECAEKPTIVQPAGANQRRSNGGEDRGAALVEGTNAA